MIQIILESLDKPDEGYFGSVRDERQHGMVQIVIDRLQNLWHKETSQSLPLTVNIGIAPSRKIYTFKRTAAVFTLAKHIRNLYITVLRYDNGTSRRKLAHTGTRHIKHSLYYRSLGSHNHDFVIDIIKCRTDAVPVAQGKHIT